MFGPLVVVLLLVFHISLALSLRTNQGPSILDTERTHNVSKDFHLLAKTLSLSPTPFHGQKELFLKNKINYIFDPRQKKKKTETMMSYVNNDFM